MSRLTDPTRFFRMAMAAMMLAFVAVVFGAYARLSEAALGCTDSYDCVGIERAPMTARDYHASMNDTVKPPPGARAWKDVVSRYVAGALGLLLIRLAVLGTRLRRRKASQQVLIPLFTLLLVMTLTVAGVAAFDLQFKPLIMLMQLLGGMTVLGLLWWVVLREQRFFRSVARSPLTRRLKRRALMALVIVSAQIALGGWSMVNYAELACPDFPTCQGTLQPPTDFVEGFTAWRAAGPAYERDSLSLPGATAIHVAHRAGALITLLYLGWLALHLLRVGGEDNLRRYGVWLIVMLSSAVELGVIATITGSPLWANVAHNAGAALLLLSAVTLYHVLRTPRVVTST